MSLSETELIYLMAYVDDQVDADELPEVTALLARSEEARQIVAQHQALGDWVRSSSDVRAMDGGADAIADAVLHEIDKQGGGKIIALETERARLALNRQRIKEFGALFAVAAAAAAFWLMPASQPEPVAVAPQPSAVKVIKSAPAPTDSALAAAAAGTPAASSSATAEADPAGVDVQSVESPDHPFSIFYVPAATGQNAHSSSVVVWIGE